MAPETKVTIAIPTYNRSGLLKSSLQSVLAQDYSDFQVLVVDNASSDDTEAVVRSYADPRINYVRNETNIGIFRNWQRTIELNSSPYLTILSDDDLLLPNFIRESVSALDSRPQVGFSVAQAELIDADGFRVEVTGGDQSDKFPEGLIDGLEFVHQIVSGRKWILLSSTILFRASAIAAVGAFDVPHSYYMSDLNLYLRLAAQFDLFFIAKELSQVRVHDEQNSQNNFRSAGGTGPIAVLAERTDAIAYLLQSKRAEDASYRQWLTERLLHMSRRRSEYTAQFIPEINISWSARLTLAIQDIAAVIPAGKRFILIDDNQWGDEVLSEFDFLPFLEHNGHYWGSPPDDQTAIQELERMRQAGLSFVVIGWPAFWWIDYYSELRDYLNSHFGSILHNSRLIVYDLRPD